MKHLKLSRFLVFCLLILAFAVVASAQEATIVGTVTDPSGAAVPGAQVTVTSVETGVVHHEVTGSAGEYVVPDIPIGHYTVKVESSGFKASEKTDLVLQVGDRTRVDFGLEIGATTDSVKVEANAIAVQSDTGEVSQVITGQEVTQIATNGRSIYSLELLVPGAANNTGSFQAPTAGGSNSQVSFDGARQNHNLYIADGAEQSDRGGAGSSNIAPSLDALSEFRVLSSNYSAEYGLSSAGTVTMVFKSGTKDFHASAWEFVRNNDFDANNFFNNAAGNPNPELRLNTYGFNVGGPVTFGKLYNKNRDKTFFFYNMEWRKLVQPGTPLDTTVIPTGSYGGSGISGHAPCSNQVSPSIAAQWVAAGIQLSTPGKDGSCNGTDGGSLSSFSSLPSTLLNSNAQALLKAGIFPAPTNAAGNAFIGQGSAPTNVREELVRIDHQFSDKFWIFGHWVSEASVQGYNPPMWSGVNVPTIGDAYSNPSFTGVIHATWAISPTLLSESSLNYDGNRISIQPNGLYQQPSGYTDSELFPGNTDNRIPGISISNGPDFDANSFPWINAANDYQIRQDISWTHGSHQFKFGGSWAIYSKVQEVFGDSQGSFGFNGTYTGNPFADFLLGYANSYSELAEQDSGHWDAVSPAAYVQDNWRVNNRLTLNLGLRWDGIPHTYEINHRMSNFYPNEYNPADAAILLPGGNAISPSTPGLTTSPNQALSGFQFYTNGIGITGENGNPNGVVNSSWWNFGPRVGFAYDLTGKGKTVLRGGFGAMYERIQGNDMYNGATNPPFSASASNNGVSFSNPGMSLLTGVTESSAIPVASLSSLAQTNYKPPVTYQYSFGVEQQFARNSVFNVSYVGSQSRHQFVYQDINLPAQSELPALIQGSVAYNTVLPYQGYGSIDMGETDENAHYNALQTSVRTQWTKDLTLQAAYTFSRSIDPDESFGGDNTGAFNPYDLHYDIGPSESDVENVGVVSFVYDLPIFRGYGNRFEKSVLGGWEVAGLWTIQSGFPLQITLGGPQGSNGLASGGAGGTLGTANRPNFNGSITYVDSASQWFTTSGFSTPALGAWGNLAKGEIRGPGRDNINLSLFKSFLLSEARDTRLEFRFETFNTLNHTQFNGIGSSFTNTAQFGVPLTAWDPRELQLGAKLIF